MGVIILHGRVHTYNVSCSLSIFYLRLLSGDNSHTADILTTIIMCILYIIQLNVPYVLKVTSEASLGSSTNNTSMISVNTKYGMSLVPNNE